MFTTFGPRPNEMSWGYGKGKGFIMWRQIASQESVVGKRLPSQQLLRMIRPDPLRFYEP